MDAATISRLLGELVDVPEVELVLDSGYGARATIPAAAVEAIADESDGVTVRCGPARLRLDLAAGAALVSHASGAGERTHAFHLTNRSGDDVLRAAFASGGEGEAPAASPGDGDLEREHFWSAFAARHAGTPGLKAVAVSASGPAGRVSTAVLLRCFAELRASGRVVFLLPGPAASAEVFPNVPLLDPHLSGDGWLYAGEPHRRDVHFHVEVARTARLRFQEERRAGPGMGPAVAYTVRFLDDSGRTQLYGSLAGAYTGPDGEVVRPSDAEREAFFRDLSRRYQAEAGVELATAAPLLASSAPAGAAAGL